MQDYSRFGLTLKQHKSGILSSPIQIYGNPCPLRIPVDLGSKILVESGSKVERYQQLSSPGPSGGAPVLAPISGTVQGVFPFDHPFYGEINIIYLTPDESSSIITRSRKRITPRTRELISAIRQAGIVDGLDRVPLADKLERFKERKIQVLAVNAIEDEPYVCSSGALILQNLDDIVEGLQLAAQFIGIPKQEIYTYRSKSYDVLKSRLSKTPEIHYLTGKYPVEKRFVADHPEMGFISAQACLDLLAAMDAGIPQTMQMLTVAGDCVTNPGNIWVPVGMSAADILNFCGLKDEPDVYVLGGSMTGYAFEDLSTPVGIGIPALLALKVPPAPDITNCCGCGDCVRCCPRRLMPVYIARFARHGKFEECASFGAERCIECGCCSYVCRGRINPAAFTALAKKEILSGMLPEKGDHNAAD